MITEAAQTAAQGFLENVAPKMLEVKTAEVRSTPHAPTVGPAGICAFCGEDCR